MQRFKKILYVHDSGSQFATQTLKLATQIADRNDGEVSLICVVEPPPAMFVSSTSLDLRKHLLDEARAGLEELARANTFTANASPRVLEGRAHVEIIREVITTGYDLVMKPIGGSRLVDRLLGRLDMKLLRQCPCPVWLSKGETYGEFDHVLAAVDADDDVVEGSIQDCDDDREGLNQKILELSSSLCADNDATLHIGHVWDAPFLSKYSRARANIPDEEIRAYISRTERDHVNWLNRLVARATRLIGEPVVKKIRVRKHLRQGVAGEIIPDLITEIEADLIVMGTVARSGIPGFIFGNTAEDILDQVTCSVLAVKPPGFVSPVSFE